MKDNQDKKGNFFEGILGIFIIVCILIVIDEGFKIFFQELLFLIPIWIGWAVVTATFHTILHADPEAAPNCGGNEHFTKVTTGFTLITWMGYIFHFYG